VKVMAGEGIGVEVACRVLDVSVSGYYAWLSRPPSAWAIGHTWLGEVIRQVHQASWYFLSHIGCGEGGRALGPR
jgi:hypothetical protein